MVKGVKDEYFYILHILSP